MKNALKYLCSSFIIIILSLFFLGNTAFDHKNILAKTCNEPSKKHNSELKSNNKDEENIKDVIENLYNKRSSAFITGDLESLKELFDTSKNVGRWSLEHEIQRVKYLRHWAYRRGIEFKNVNSKVLLRKKSPSNNRIRLTLKEIYKFDYVYKEDEDPLTNSFGVGILHNVTLIKKDDKYVIASDWYTDCFEDALKAYSGEITPWDFSKDEVFNLPNTPKEIQDSYEGRYNRIGAIEYADKYCGASLKDTVNYKYNKKYMNFNGSGGDCTNFASQVLREGGGLKFDGSWRCEYPKYGRAQGTHAWVNADGFRNYLLYSGKGRLIRRGTFKQLALPNESNTTGYVGKLELGDLVCYAKGHNIDHFAIVTAWDSHGYPLINSHTTDRYHVPWDLGWGDKNIYFHLIHVR